jgi:very-short-patch-repair endonuclease
MIRKIKRNYIPYNINLTKRARDNRKNPTVAEKKMWYRILRSRSFENYKFLRQKPLDNFIVDFYCSELLLVIEIDGDSHVEQIDYDNLRTKKLNGYGIEVVRYTNLEVINNIEGVYDDLSRRVEKREINKTHPNPPLSGRG